MVEISGIEPLTSCVQGRRSPSWAISPCHRLFITLFTSITHSIWVVGLSGLEPPTSPLSGVRSNHLSYRPKGITAFCSILSTIYQSICVDTYCLSFLVRRWSNRRFPYGYLVTTSPQSWITKWYIILTDSRPFRMEIVTSGFKKQILPRICIIGEPAVGSPPYLKEAFFEVLTQIVWWKWAVKPLQACSSGG